MCVAFLHVCVLCHSAVWGPKACTLLGDLLTLLEPTETVYTQWLPSTCNLNLRYNHRHVQDDHS